MPTAPTLVGLPAAPEEPILDAIERTLADDPTIGTNGTYPIRLGLTGRVPDDEQDVSLDSTSVPYVKVRTGDVPLRRWTEDQHKATFVVLFDCYHAGLNDRDMLRLVAAVVSALMPPRGDDVSRSDLVKARFVAAKSLPGRFTRGPAQKVNVGESVWGRVATLQLEINCYLNTP